jgi:hypothetical protein
MSPCPNCGYDAGKSVISDYVPVVTPPTAGVAVPGVYEYREKYKQQKLKPQDVTTPRKQIESIPRLDSELDKFSYDGDSLFFGKGLEEDF